MRCTLADLLEHLPGSSSVSGHLRSRLPERQKDVRLRRAWIPMPRAAGSARPRRKFGIRTPLPFDSCADTAAA